MSARVLTLAQSAPPHASAEVGTVKSATMCALNMQHKIREETLVWQRKLITSNILAEASPLVTELSFDLSQTSHMLLVKSCLFELHYIPDSFQC